MEALDHNMEALDHNMEALDHSMVVALLDPNMVALLDPNMVALDPNMVALDPNMVALDPNMVDHNMVALVALDLKWADNMAANSMVDREANNMVDLVRCTESRRCQDSNRCNHHIPLNTLQSRLCVTKP